MNGNRTCYHRGFMLLTLCATLLGSGCAMNRRYVHDSVRQIAHRDVSIQYMIEESAEPVDADGGETTRSHREMQIIFPHPSPRYGRNFAQVTVRNVREVEEQASSVWDRLRHPVRQAFHAAIERETAEGTVTIAVPREDVELLLQDLIADGLFDRGERLGHGVRLAVAIDARSVDKNWDRVDALDRLVARATVTGSGRRATPDRQPVSPATAATTGTDDEVHFVPNPSR